MHPRISIRGCVRPSVGPSVRPSVRPSVCHAFVKNAWNWEFYAQKWSRRHTKSWITSKQLSSISTTKGGYCRTQISSKHLSFLCKRICPKMLEDALLAAGPSLICINTKPAPRLVAERTLLTACVLLLRVYYQTNLVIQYWNVALRQPPPLLAIM